MIQMWKAPAKVNAGDSYPLFINPEK